MTEREMIGQQITYNKNSRHRNLLNIDDFSVLWGFFNKRYVIGAQL